MLSQLQKAIELERLPTALRIGSDGTGVTDTFSVHVGASSLTVLLGPLPASSDLDTVAVELPPTARLEWFRPIEPYMGSPAWFRLLLGQQCTVTTKTRVVNGLLRHQDKDEIMLQKDDMLHSVSMASMVTFSVQLPAAAVNLSDAPSQLRLLVRVGGMPLLARQPPVVLRYVCTEFSYSIAHTLTLNAAHDRMQISSLAALRNGSSVDLEECTVTLVERRTDRVRPLAHMKKQHYAQAAEAAPPTAMMAMPAVERTVTGSRTLLVPGTVPLLANSTLDATLGDRAEVPCRYRFMSRSYTCLCTDAEPQRTLRLLDFERFADVLPSGMVTCLHRSKAGALEPLLDDLKDRHWLDGWQDTQRTQLPLGHGLEVRVQRSLAESRNKAQSNRRVVRMRIDILNHTAAAALVRLEEELPATLYAKSIVGAFDSVPNQERDISTFQRHFAEDNATLFKRRTPPVFVEHNPLDSFDQQDNPSLFDLDIKMPPAHEFCPSLCVLLYEVETSQ